MFIHEMTMFECRQALDSAHFGRLACARDNQPYILPMNFSVDGNYLYLYGFTTLGKKVEWMRSNPLVCFEIDNVVNQSDWTSVIVFGRYEELPDTPEFEVARQRAYEHLQKRAMWWEPAYISQTHRDTAHSLTPVFYRITIENMTGHRATPDENAGAPAWRETSVLQEQPTDSDSLKGQWARVVKAAVAYFLIVFGAGFIFAPIRILLAVPRFGERVAELLQAPLMLLVIIVAANWIVRRFQIPAGAIYRLAVGVIALALVVLAEFALVLNLRGLTLGEYFATRDAVAAMVYYLTLTLFALMPLLVKRKTRPQER